MEDRTRHQETRRGGWLSIPSLEDIRSPVQPAYSVYDRLRHIHEAPLQNLRRSYWWVRNTFFTRPRSETPAYLVEATKPEVHRLFGRQYFEPNWELSYNYHGEILNLRRVVFAEEPEYDWWQVHVRGYEHGESGIELTAHYETEPAQHPDAHVDLHGLDVDHGMDVIEDILEAESVPYELLEPGERIGIDGEHG